MGDRRILHFRRSIRRVRSDVIAQSISVLTRSRVRSFRRTRIDQLLAQPKQFDLAVVLVKPSQRIIISVSCELLGE